MLILKDHASNIFSQDGEDGIISHIFDYIGSTNKFCVEFGAYNGAACSNTCNLRLNHSWKGLLLDRKGRYGFAPKTIKSIMWYVKKQETDIDIVGIIRLFLESKCIKECLISNGSYSVKLISGWEKILFKHRAVSRLLKLNKFKYLRKIHFSKDQEKKIAEILKHFYVHHVWITAENIMSIFNKYGVPQMFDLLSIDIDGNDYWMWNAITSIARVVVIEFNSSLGPEESKVIPYSPDFKYSHDNYFGASLLALQKLGNIKGYSLIHHNAPFNTFFVRSDLLPIEMRNIPLDQLYPHAIPHPKLKKCPPGKKWINV